MPKTYWERRCEDIWRRIILLKYPHCVISGKPHLEFVKPLAVHHIFFKSGAKGLSPAIKFDTRFGVSLTDYNHTGDDNPSAPHGLCGSDKRFIRKLKKHLPKEAWKPIQQQISAPKEKTIGKPDYKKILDGLKHELKQLDKTAYMDADCEPTNPNYRTGQ